MGRRRASTLSMKDFMYIELLLRYVCPPYRISNSTGVDILQDTGRQVSGHRINQQDLADWPWIGV